MESAPKLATGEAMSCSRTFTVEMVEAFARLSGDTGRHHVIADDRGRLIVHGLLVASIATELGGRINLLARNLDFEFVRPVYTGDLITCTVRLDEVTPEPRRTRLSMTGEAVNQTGEIVLRIVARGVVLG